MWNPNAQDKPANPYSTMTGLMKMVCIFITKKESMTAEATIAFQKL